MLASHVKSVVVVSSNPLQWYLYRCCPSGIVVFGEDEVAEVDGDVPNWASSSDKIQQSHIRSQLGLNPRPSSSIKLYVLHMLCFFTSPARLSGNVQFHT
jgi:hypothetical protein